MWSQRVIVLFPVYLPITYWSPYWICTQHPTCQWSLTSIPAIHEINALREVSWQRVGKLLFKSTITLLGIIGHCRHPDNFNRLYKCTPISKCSAFPVERSAHFGALQWDASLEAHSTSPQCIARVHLHAARYTTVVYRCKTCVLYLHKLYSTPGLALGSLVHPFWTCKPAMRFE